MKGMLGVVPEILAVEQLQLIGDKRTVTLEHSLNAILADVSALE